MDTVNSPEEMCFGGVDVSDKWRLFMTAVMNDKHEEQRCAMFLFHWRRRQRERERAVTIFTFEVDELNKLEPLFREFRQYCKPRKNLTIERDRLTNRYEGVGEPVYKWITDLKSLVRSCEHGALEASLITDQRVRGVNRPAVRERLLREDHLEFAKAVKILRINEQSKEEVRVFGSIVTTRSSHNVGSSDVHAVVYNKTHHTDPVQNPS